jgi:hypothetical protein
MSFIKARRAVALAAAAVFTGACGESLAPIIDHVDATAATAASEPVVAVMDQPALASFASLASVSGLPSSASSASISAVSRLTKAAAGGRWDGLTPSLARSAARAADVLPVDVRGNMYVYNTSTSTYEVASSAETGVPANGIRIVLYAWDVLSGAPSSPLTRIGHVDLIDESNASQNRLNVVLVRADGTQLMDYDITHSLTSSSESFSIAGSATNGTTPVTFNLSGNASETAATITFDLAAASVGFEVHVGMNLNALTQQATIETSLKYDGHTLSFRLSAHEDGIDGEVRFDGMRYATLTITVVETPTSVTTTTSFVKANGQPMTIEEIEQIQAVFERALDFDRFWEGLLWPIGALAASPV